MPQIARFGTATISFKADRGVPKQAPLRHQGVRVELILGICPSWFAMAQGACALAITAAGFVVDGSAARAAFLAAR
ncbi:hypothetical protein [Nocardia sp. NPDC052566]|uniref:hypothetical protein n=1 Tax=Nocardia sp. NPDC052566 TaxID=3364330 RepID=UPI0037CA2EE5